jgi:hypothetical protein
MHLTTKGCLDAYINKNSKRSLIFQEECRIFCEGEWEVTDDGNAVIKQQSAVGPNGIGGLIGLLSPNGFVGLNLVGHTGLISLNGFVRRILVEHFGLMGLGQNDLNHLIGLMGLIGHTGLIGLNDLVGHNNLVNHVGHVSHTICRGGIICIVSHTGLIGLNGLNSLNSIINLNGNIRLDGIIGLMGHNSLIDIIGLIGLDLVDHNDLVGFFGLGLVSLARLINDISLIGPSGISGLISFIGPSLIGIVNHSGLIGLVSLAGLIGHISLVGPIGISGISGLAGQISLVSLGGLISDINFISGFVGLVSVSLISFGGLISDISLVSLIGLSIYWPFKLVTHGVAIKLPSVTGITKVMMQAAHGVATVSSATKITNPAILLYCTASHSFVRESLLSHVLLLTGRLNLLFFGDTLQNAKQEFSVRIPQMTKYCIMKERENILHGYLYVFDLAFVILKGISIFKFPKRFLEIFSRDLTSFLLQLI